MFRALIVDDEPLARRTLQVLLSKYPQIAVAGECDHAAAATVAIRALKPDLLFIDVQMPGATGLDALRAAGVDAVPVVVFTTAYPEYALQAFEVHALDYLLKPWSDERFADVMTRVLRALNAPQAQVDADEPALGHDGQRPRTLTIRDAGRVLVIPVRDIDWIEAEDYCTRIHARDRHLLVRRSMQALLQDLEGYGFARIHRSSIVNLERVREVRPASAGDADVLLADGTLLRMSRTFRADVERRVVRA